MSIKINVLPGRIEVGLPYALMSVFEDLFKSARWSDSAKAWELKNTAANRVGLERFKELANGLSIKMQELERVEFQVRDIEYMRCAIERLEKETDYHLQSYQSFLAVNEGLDSLKKIHEYSLALAEEAVEKNAAIKREVESKIDAILNVYGAHELIKKLLNRSRVPGGRREREAAKDKLFEIYELIRRDYLLEVDTLYEIFSASWYELGRYKLPVILERLYLNVRVVGSSQAE